jgi:DHA1 family bicyclomycin/chloramphenicol resistance-like MFS transporter
MNAPARAENSVDPGMGFHAFVSLMAAFMAVNSLGIDAMVAALPDIGRAFHVATDNRRQWVIAAYMLGFGVAQLIYGPLSDHFGRKPLIVTSMFCYAAMSLAAGFAPSFEVMIGARVLQGVAGAASRVLVVSIVRDCYSGRRMARVMSLTFIVFLIVPAIAPGLGQAIDVVAGWRAIFIVLSLFGALVGTIAALRLKETLHPEYRRPVSFAGIAEGIKGVLGERIALGYTIGQMMMFATLMSYINSIQQIFSDIFHQLTLFPAMFAAQAVAMASAAFVNSRLVERLGTRRISHTALIGFIVISAVHAALALLKLDTLASFAVAQCLIFFFFGMIGSNFSAMAMERVGHIAGTASSVQGFVTTVGGTTIGIIVGQCYDGTTLPLALGFLGGGVCALIAVLLTERGRLFNPHHAMQTG